MGYPALILAILAMAIMLMFGTPSSLNPDKFRRNGDVARLTSTIQAVVQDIQTYEVSAQKKINIHTWSDELTAYDAFPPRSNDSREWSMGTNANGRYLCVSLPASPGEYQKKLYQEVSDILDFQTIVSESCGDLVAWDGASTINSLSLSVYIGD